MTFPARLTRNKLQGRKLEGDGAIEAVPTRTGFHIRQHFPAPNSEGSFNMAGPNDLKTLKKRIARLWPETRTPLLLTCRGCEKRRSAT